jgi:hypothetical protein
VQGSPTVAVVPPLEDLRTCIFRVRKPAFKHLEMGFMFAGARVEELRCSCLQSVTPNSRNRYEEEEASGHLLPGLSATRSNWYCGRE